MRTTTAALAAFFMLAAIFGPNIPPASAEPWQPEILSTAMAQTMLQDPALAPLPAGAEVIRIPATPATPAPVIVQASPPPVSFPIGDIMSGLLGYVWVGLAGLVTFGLRKLPPQLYALAMTMRVDQLLTKAIAFGINSVPGAIPGQKLNVNIANPVLRVALSFVAKHGGSIVKHFAGERGELAEKLWARLDLTDDAVAPNFNRLAAEVDMAMPRKENA